MVDEAVHLLVGVFDGEDQAGACRPGADGAEGSEFAGAFTEFLDSVAVAGGGGGQYAAPTHHVRVNEVAAGEGYIHHAACVAQGEGDELFVGECHF